MEIYDADRNLRSTIDTDGTVKSVDNTVIGYINEDGSTGDSEQSFVGEINDDGQIINSKDEVVGQLDQGTAEISVHGGHFCTIAGGGDISGARDEYVGKVDNFSFHNLRIIAAYLLFFDQGLVDLSRPSKFAQNSVDQSLLYKNEEPTKQKSEDRVEHDSVSLTLPTPKPKQQQQQHQQQHQPVEHEPVSLSLPAPKPKQQQQQPIEHEPVSLSLPQPEKSKQQHPAIRQYKDYQVGDFLTIDEGKKNLLEIHDCDCQLSQLSVRLEKEGKQIVFQRTIQVDLENVKQQVRRFTLPFTITLDQLHVKYDANKNGGTLTFTITKPDPSKGPSSGEFCRFLINGNSSASADSKITMNAGQGSSFFQFQPIGETKHDTELIGQLENGEDIKFVTITTIIEENVRNQATQTFTLPFQVSLAHIEVQGKKIIVHSKPINNTVTSQPTPTTPDTDVQIHT